MHSAACQQAPTVEGLGLIPDIVERAKRLPGAGRQGGRDAGQAGGRAAGGRGQVADGESPAARRAILGAAWRSAPRRSSRGHAATGPLKYIALLDIPAFGLAALVALKRVEDLQWAELAVRQAATGSGTGRSRCGSSSRPRPSRSATR